jgi:Lon protease-like protein
MVHIEGEAWPANPSIRPIGCAGRIGEVTPLPEGRMLLALHGLRKFRVLKERRRGAYRTARVEWIEDLNENACGPAADAAVRRIIERLDLAARAREEEPAGTRLDDRSLPFVGRVNQLALSTRLDRDEFVGVLELRDVYARARRLVRLLDSRADARSRAARFRPFLTDDPARN